MTRAQRRLEVLTVAAFLFGVVITSPLWLAIDAICVGAQNAFKDARWMIGEVVEDIEILVKAWRK